MLSHKLDNKNTYIQAIMFPGVASYVVACCYVVYGIKHYQYSYVEYIPLTNPLLRI